MSSCDWQRRLGGGKQHLVSHDTTDKTQLQCNWEPSAQLCTLQGEETHLHAQRLFILKDLDDVPWREKIVHAPLALSLRDGEVPAHSSFHSFHFGLCVCDDCSVHEQTMAQTSSLVSFGVPDSQVSRPHMHVPTCTHDPGHTVT